jgi:hypothetical protein
MSQETHEDAKKMLDEIRELLKDETLSMEERNTLEIHAVALSGALSSSWLPYGWGRRLIMISILALGLYGLAIENHAVLFCWLLLPLFSPRIVGEVSYFLGKLSKDA